MKKIMGIALLGLAASACAAPITGKPAGGASIYSDVQFNERSENNTLGAKRGEACATNILGILATGDASAATAAKAGGITKIATIDGTSMGVLGLYGKYCVVVTGE